MHCFTEDELRYTVSGCSRNDVVNENPEPTVNLDVQLSFITGVKVPV